MSPSDPPDFSIVVPSRDRRAQLAACLEAIACLDYPRSGFEVIVVPCADNNQIELSHPLHVEPPAF